MLKDIYSITGKYQKNKKELYSSEHKNMKFVKEFIDWKEKRLLAKKGRDENARLRIYKTLNKYINLLSNVATWFDKPLNQLTKKDMQDFYDDFEEGKILSHKGKPFAAKTRRDYYNKVFKSDFFKHLGLIDIAREVFILEKDEDEEVRYFEYEDLIKMIEKTEDYRKKGLLFFLFDTGMRIGEVLNLKVGDVEFVIENEDRELKGEEFFRVHMKAEYSKSKKARTVTNWLDETVGYMKYIVRNRDRNEFLFDWSVSNVRKIIRKLSKLAKVKTTPASLPINIHDFRRSCASYFVRQRRTIDAIKARLGHKPSSNVIDKYVSYHGLDQKEDRIELKKARINKKIESIESENDELREKIEDLQIRAEFNENKYNKLREDMIAFIKEEAARKKLLK